MSYIAIIGNSYFLFFIFLVFSSTLVGKKERKKVATELNNMLHIVASIKRIYSKYGSSVGNIPVYAGPVGGSIL